MDSEDDGVSANYRYEPTAAEILDNLLPLYVRTLILQSFLETEAGEHASRMTATTTRRETQMTTGPHVEFNRARRRPLPLKSLKFLALRRLAKRLARTFPNRSLECPTQQEPSQVMDGSYQLSGNV